MQNFKILGIPTTKGELIKLIESFPDDTSFGFRNMPILELVETTDDDDVTYLSFQYPAESMQTIQEMIDEGYFDGKKSFTHLAKEIHDSFNWNNVYVAMRALDWQWSLGIDASDKKTMGIPSIDTLKNEAFRLLKQAYDDGHQHSAGGLTAGWENNELYLSFILEDAVA